MDGNKKEEGRKTHPSVFNLLPSSFFLSLPPVPQMFQGC
jgi:hypothetical protein